MSGAAQASPPVRVIAIDSIAAVFRGAGESAFSKAAQGPFNLYS